MTMDTKTQILESAERMTQLKGFDAFSYRDISDEIGIKTSSIHYHFPTKADLAAALVDRYTLIFSDIFASITALKTDGLGRIKSLFKTLRTVSGKDKNFCLCGMLSADIHAVKASGKTKLNHFFTLFENGIEQLLKEGAADGSVHNTIRPKSSAMEIVAAVEGAMLIARARNDERYLEETLDIVLARLRA